MGHLPKRKLGDKVAFYVGIILSKHTNENNVVENMNFVQNNTFSLKTTTCMFLVICRRTLYRSHIKVYMPPSKKIMAGKSSVEKCSRSTFLKNSIFFKNRLFLEYSLFFKNGLFS